MRDQPDNYINSFIKQQFIAFYKEAIILIYFCGVFTGF